MIFRLVTIAVIGFYLGGYLPRVLVSGQHGWVVWVLAAALVFGAPRALRLVARRAVPFGRKA
jgi:hypothetical protein